MRCLSLCVSFVRSLFRGRALDRELDEELRGYVDALTARHVERGLTPEAARRAALIELGGIEQVKEQVRDVRVGWRFETLRRDVAYGCRMFARAPGFSLVVVLTLALVIGANATVFSVMYAVMWRELPYPEADRLVVVDADAGGVKSAGLASPEAVDLRAERNLFDGLATIVAVNANVTADDTYERVPGASATDDALRLLGAEPLAYGRLTDARRDIGEQSVRSVVISNELWRRRFNGDPSIVGRHAEINNLRVEIAGVLRPGFRVLLPANAAQPEIVDVWFPNTFEGSRLGRNQVSIARLRPGVSLRDAQARVDLLAERAMRDYPADYATGRLQFVVRPLSDVLTADVRPALRVLAGAVGFVLLIGCVNLFNLMLARARVREPEIAVRRALGAGSSRLVAQLVTETALLAAIGAAAGFALASGGVALVDWLRPAHLPRQSDIAVNFPVALFIAGLAVVVTLGVGLLPALRAQSQRHNEPLRAGRANVQRSGTRRLQRSLVIGEVALSIVPLVAAGLMLRTFVNLTNAPIGFDPDDRQTAKIAFSARLFPQHEQRLLVHLEALENLRQIRGVERVSLVSPLPFTENHFTRNYGRTTDAPPLLPRATMQTAFPGYFAVAGIRLLAGRDFTTEDLVHQRDVVVIDERMATQLWPDGAVGQQLAVSRGRGTVAMEVIGVTNNVRVTRVRDDSMPNFFVPYHFFPLEMGIVAKTDRTSESIAAELKHAVESLGTRRPVYDIRSMRSYVDQSIGDARFTMLILLGFAAASLLLSAVGVYGTLAYLTSQRTQEFGVRMALGASAGQILRSVAGEGLLLTTLGSVAGFAGATLLSSALHDLLYGVEPFDLTTLASAAAVMAIAALIATAHPAWRAASVDPASTLRQ